MEDEVWTVITGRPTDHGGRALPTKADGPFQSSAQQPYQSQPPMSVAKDYGEQPPLQPIRQRRRDRFTALSCGALVALALLATVIVLGVGLGAGVGIGRATAHDKYDMLYAKDRNCTIFL